MDNPNDPNTPNNSGPAPSFGSPPQPFPTPSSTPPPTLPPSGAGPSWPPPSPGVQLPPTPEPVASQDQAPLEGGQASAWNPPVQTPSRQEPTPAPDPSTWASDPIPNAPVSPPLTPPMAGPAPDNGPTSSLTSSWIPPIQSKPQSAPDPTPFSPPTPEPVASQDQAPLEGGQASAWNPPVQTPSPAEPTLLPSDAEPNLPMSGPTPTFTPPAPAPQAQPEPNLSTLDNPWGSPPQPPPIEGSQPTTQPSWMNTPGSVGENQTADTSPPSPLEAAPTDLSHLINNNSQSEISAQGTPETLIASSTPSAPDVPTVPTENHKGIPRWLIGLGVGLLITVAGVSAYFVLGIGQPKETTSLPATTVPKTSEVKPPAPIATPVVRPTEQPATGSGNFGQLGGSGGNQQATSAADLIRQRQQGR